MNEKVFTINKPEDLDKYVEAMFKDIDNIMERKIKIEKNAIAPLTIRIPSEEDTPYIDNLWMEAFIKARENIITSLELGLDKKLTNEERNKVKIKVYVEKGSRIFGFFTDLSEFLGSEIVEVLPNMTVGQLLAVVVPITVGYLAGRYISESKRKETEIHKANLEHQRELKKQESEDTRIQLLSNALTASEESRLIEAKDKQETTIRVLDLLDKVVANEQKNEASMARQMLKMPEANDIEINGEEVKKESLKELAKPTKKKTETERVTINDKFKISVMEFKDNETSVVLYNENYKFKNFSLPKEHFSQKAIQKINNREPLHIIVTANKKDGVIQEILAITILDDEE